MESRAQVRLPWQIVLSNPLTDLSMYVEKKPLILDEFVQDEVVDYSFSHPDRRLDDSPFFLPDFNETECTVKKIPFMIDTSGSMEDSELTQVFSEIKGAIDQYN